MARRIVEQIGEWILDAEHWTLDPEAFVGIILLTVMVWLFFIFGVMLVSASIGLWKLYPWARRLMIWLQVPWIVMSLVGRVLVPSLVLSEVSNRYHF